MSDSDFLQKEKDTLNAETAEAILNSTRSVGYMSMATYIEALVRQYTVKRHYKDPDLWQGMGWVNTEIGEVYEAMLSMASQDWVRNNAEDHPVKTSKDLEEEMGDVIFMIIYTGLVNGLNPLTAMTRKMHAKADLG